MHAQATAIDRQGRPEVSVYWRPGCSSCLKVKEFVEGTGIPFESINVMAKTESMEEIMAAGLRSIPAVRKGERFVYAQSLEDVAALLGVTRRHVRLPNDKLFDRWLPVLMAARRIIEKFSEDDLKARVIPVRERTVKEIAQHIYQVAHAFMRQIDEGITEIKPIHAYVDPSIVTKQDLLAFADRRLDEVRAWLDGGGPARVPDRIVTYYGEQEGGQVVERAVWHSTQHARQLDIITAGRLGAELELSAELYEGLPLPERLWV